MVAARDDAEERIGRMARAAGIAHRARIRDRTHAAVPAADAQLVMGESAADSGDRGVTQSEAERPQADDRVRVLHVITGLETGGAETFLYNLSALLLPRVDSRILSLSAGGAMVQPFEHAGMRVTQLGLRGKSGLFKAPAAAMRVRREMRQWRPQVIQGWLNHGNVAATLIRRLNAPSARLIWSVMQSFNDIEAEKPGTRRAIRLQVRLSAQPDSIICNSYRAKEQLIQLGCAGAALGVIPNGFDIVRFRPSAQARIQMRELIGACDGDFVVGMVARLHPVKDYPSFIRAAALAARSIPRLRVVCVGPGVASSGSPLRALVRDLGLEQRCTLLDERSGMERVYPGLDLLCLTSLTEGSPNVIGEAMACGVPCVATNVGDSAAIIDNTGTVVMPGDPAAVSTAIVHYARLAEDARADLAARARDRIVQRYSMAEIAEQYMAQYVGQASRA